MPKPKARRLFRYRTTPQCHRRSKQNGLPTFPAALRLNAVVQPNAYFLPGRCVRAEAAAVLAALLAFGSFITLDAAAAALELVASLLLLWVRVEAAAVLAFLLDFGSFMTFDAAAAALLLVLSLFFAAISSPSKGWQT
jgi:hypothetical protein